MKKKKKKNLHRAGFEPAKLTHKILSLTPLTAREPMLIAISLYSALISINTFYLFWQNLSSFIIVNLIK